MKLSTYKRTEAIETILMVLFFSVVVLLLLSYPIIELTTIRYITITVKDKESVSDGDKSKYLIWTERGEVFENTDALLLGKFNSSDVYGQLEIGASYDVRVNGYRVPFLSWYRNIISIEERID